MIFDTVPNMILYHQTPAWKKAMDYLMNLPRECADGEYEITGKTVFARVMTYDTKPEQDAFPEAHRQYIDIQTLLFGEELALCDPLDALEIKTPYDDTTDVAFYYPQGVSPVKTILRPGVFAAFFPKDAHRPSISTGDTPLQVKKVVVKIAVSEFKW